MTFFWIATAVMALGTCAVMVLALMRGRRDTGPAEAFDLQVYRDQLKEIERDITRGVIPAEEGDRLRTEVSRRILAADSKVQGTAEASGQPRTVGTIVAGLIGALVLVGGYGLYLQVGAPGYPDLPLQQRIADAATARENRPSQADAEAQVPAAVPSDVPSEYSELVIKLRAAVAERPDDLQGHRLLVRSEAALGNYAAAWKAQSRILALKGDDATAADYADLADMMILAAGGYVSPEAQRALEAAISRDPKNGVARYYGGLMMAQTGRPDVAFRMWDGLLRESAPDAAWLAPIREQIAEMAFRAGVSDYQLPAAPVMPGPTQDDINAAGQMSAEDRADMIKNMVARLSDRLATEGGPPEEWSRLIGALGVLGDTEQAKAIWVEAQAVFADVPGALEQVNAAAAQAGLTE